MFVFSRNSDYRNLFFQIRKLQLCFAANKPIIFTNNFSTNGTDDNKVIRSSIKNIEVNHKPLSELIWKDLDKWSSKIAIQCGETGRKYTYTQLRRLCTRFANVLKKKKAQKGQIVSVVLPNIPEYPIILLGSLEAGLIVTTLNPNYTPVELSHQLADNKSTLIVTLSSLVEKVQSAIKLAERKVQSEFPTSIITLDDNSGSFSTFERMLHEHADDNVELETATRFDDVALMPYSSGTTGLPKGVQLTHSNLVHNLIQSNHPSVKITRTSDGDQQDVVPAIIPFFHIFGISASILNSIVNGSKVVTLTKFDPHKYLNIIRNDKATILHLVPSLAVFFNSSPLIKPNDLKHIQGVFCAGGAIPVAEIENLMRLSDNNMIVKNAYGLTETGPAACITQEGDPLNSCGQPLAFTEMKIIDASGSSLEAYQRGEICVRGPQVMKGYFNNHKATTDTIDEKGFLHTGDVGYYNNDKQFFCIDRIKELIKVKGFQVAPAELETILKKHNAVKDVGVVGVPDRRTGEKPIAFIVPKGDKKNINVDELKRFVAEEVAPYKQLASIVIIDEVPRNPSGKVLRRILRDMYKE